MSKHVHQFKYNLKTLCLCGQTRVKRTDRLSSWPMIADALNPYEPPTALERVELVTRTTLRRITEKLRRS